MTGIRRLLCLMISLGVHSVARGEPIAVTDLEGRTITIELLEMSGDTIAFTIPGRGDKEFELPLKRFDQASRTRITETGAELKPRMPKVEFDVVIGKRRKKAGWYLIDQTVTSKVIVKNVSRSTPLPETAGRIVFIGRSRSNGDNYKVLAVEDFKVSAKAGRSAEFVPESFVTQYDSDNRGSGNIGGYQYEAYIVALFDADGHVFKHKTSSPPFRSAMESNLRLVHEVIKYPVGTQTNKDLGKVQGTVR